MSAPGIDVGCALCFRTKEKRDYMVPLAIVGSWIVTYVSYLFSFLCLCFSLLFGGHS